MTIGFEMVYPTPGLLSIEMWNITAIEVGIEASTAAAEQERALCPCRMAVHGEGVFVPYPSDHTDMGLLCY